ncbi:ATP synthase subunit I [candidate division CSSED10-310 bacterium]|uniref:ATP synthase subunit I n=1 Tax=candidate division CSSED10-310 bacterium TaxID=2855610 RepID=A0ABV6YVQ2_UNCC1
MTNDNQSFKRIERNLIVLASLVTGGGFLTVGFESGVGAFLGSLVAFANFRLIQVGVKKIVAEEEQWTARKYVLFSGGKLLGLALFLGFIFYTFKPSFVFFLIGFSLLFPAILWETMINISKSDDNEIGEPISGSRN